ncbi:MAG: extracellular solute-binding protein [Verrucomicrobiota bacterium]
MKNCYLFFFLVLISTLPFINCSPNKDQKSLNTSLPPIEDQAIPVEDGGEIDPIASDQAVRGGVFNTWGGGYPKSINQWLDYNQFSSQLSSLMFEPLIGMHSTENRPVGVLASSWEISEDKTTYTFKIHAEAKWSDGTDITAQDIQFYYDIIMDPKHLTSLFRVSLSKLDRPEILDKKTLRVRANEVHWRNFWTAGGLTAFPKHAWKDLDFNSIHFEFPVVSGPYQIHEVKTNRSISLKRRGDWWGRTLKFNQHKYNFDYLVFKSLEDRTKALEVLKKGDFDLYPIYTARIWERQTNFPQVQKNWVVRQTIYNQEPKSFQGFAINLRKKKFQDKQVRLALGHLLNRELMLEKLMFGQYFLLNNYFPDLYPNNTNPNHPLIQYSPEKARKLLGQAGWKINDQGLLEKDGEIFSLKFLYHGTPLPHLTIFLEDLKKVGLQAELDVVSLASFRKRMDNHEFDLAWTNWSASRLRDPESMWHSKTADDIATQNIPGIENEEIDQLIEKQKSIMDIDQRNEIIKEIDLELIDTIPYILLWQSDRHKLLYWNRFGTPKTILDKFNREDSALVYWWFDQDKADALLKAQQSNSALPAVASEIHYSH